MPQQSPVVDLVVRFETVPPLIRVHFRQGAGLLNPAVPRDKVWLEVLEWLHQNRRPAYVEFDPDTHHITSLLLPQPFRVRRVEQIPQSRDLRVELEVSHAVHYVRANLPGADQIAADLRAALAQDTEVLVTQSSDTSAIIDVRPRI